jgi:hypothetical protein
MSRQSGRDTTMITSEHVALRGEGMLHLTLIFDREQDYITLHRTGLPVAISRRILPHLCNVLEGMSYTFDGDVEPDAVQSILNDVTLRYRVEDAVVDLSISASNDWITVTGPDETLRKLDCKFVLHANDLPLVLSYLEKWS